MRTRFMYLIKSPLRQTFLNLRNVHTEYRSAISLSSLYPESSLNLATPVKPPQNENGKFSGYIPVEKLELSYCRSSGPGGQHVNKVNTKVDLRFHLKSADWLSEETKAQLAEKVTVYLLKLAIPKNNIFSSMYCIYSKTFSFLFHHCTGKITFIS